MSAKVTALASVHTMITSLLDTCPEKYDGLLPDHYREYIKDSGELISHMLTTVTSTNTEQLRFANDEKLILPNVRWYHDLFVQCRKINSDADEMREGFLKEMTVICSIFYIKSIGDVSASENEPFPEASLDEFTKLTIRDIRKYT
jgi:hypothetical protein